MLMLDRFNVPSNTVSAPVKLLAVLESCKTPLPAFVRRIGAADRAADVERVGAESIPTVLSAAKVIGPAHVLLP